MDAVEEACSGGCSHFCERHALDCDCMAAFMHALVWQAVQLSSGQIFDQPGWLSGKED